MGRLSCPAFFLRREPQIRSVIKAVWCSGGCLLAKTFGVLSRRATGRYPPQAAPEATGGQIKSYGRRGERLYTYVAIARAGRHPQGRKRASPAAAGLAALKTYQLLSWIRLRACALNYGEEGSD